MCPAWSALTTPISTVSLYLSWACAECNSSSAVRPDHCQRGYGDNIVFSDQPIFYFYFSIYLNEWVWMCLRRAPLWDPLSICPKYANFLLLIVTCYWRSCPILLSMVSLQVWLAQEILNRHVKSHVSKAFIWPIVFCFRSHVSHTYRKGHTCHLTNISETEVQCSVSEKRF